MKKIVTLVLIILVLGSCVLVLGSCVPGSGEAVNSPENSISYNYEYIIVDGMPCLINEVYKQGAMTCDWSKWDGQVEDGEIVLP